MPDLRGVTVLQVIPTLETGGAERTTLEVGRALITAGARSLVVSEGGPLVESLVAEGTEHVSLPVASKNPLLLASNGTALRRLIAAEGVDLIHARSRAPAWSALMAARGAKIPFVTTYHGIYSGRTAPKRLYNSVMARGDAVIANSAYTAAAVARLYGAKPWFPPAARFVTIPRGADLSLFDPDQVTAAQRAAALAAFGGEGAFRVLMPGRLTSWKGQEDVVEAVAQLRPDGEPPLRVVLIGSAQGRDAYEDSLERRISDLGISDIVHIHGHWDDMPAAYDWADVTLSASRRPEAFGRVAVEAQAMGCPVIATAHGGSLETVDPAHGGTLVPPSAPDALSAALAQMLQRPPADREAMGAVARRRILREFSIEAMTSATLSVYRAVL
ncbi:glycosyl transferase, group 1 family protein [Parvularcula bermudensis HTCC2503]|uniref:Glycosyl transferase, group 1 family protein n=1 Tax=Parvularcula bermudensis (strain ATCC BAA-594 / HTCC2503 / KCTC 12087) TaxID=314260 RepID=E0TI51_PARBH|nr:glycosyltransferase family 4 protein [Parvularcula bermudensis]ADM09390.1 glycosyl transferase, group 1 family protein [Parvularcula bermudensis HTCC2503]